MLQIYNILRFINNNSQKKWVFDQRLKIAQILIRKEKKKT